jgi:hypothetical protein
MGAALGEVLVYAVAVAISPVVILPVVAILGTPRARTNGPAFTVGWFAGLMLVGAVIFLLAPDPGAPGDPATWVSLVKLGLGLVLVGLAVRQFRARSSPGDEPTLPAWMGAIDRLSAPKAFGMAAALGGANPKSLLLAAAAVGAIVETEIARAEQAAAYTIFAAIGTLGAAIPVAMYLVLGEGAARRLDRLRGWMTRNGAVILAVILLLIGAKLIGDAVTGFSVE